MLRRLADLGIHHPRRVALAALLVVLVAGAFGGPAATVLQARNDFEDSGSQSAAAQRQIERASGMGAAPGVIALVDARPGGGDVPAVRRILAADRAVARVDQQGSNGRSTVLAVTLRAGADDHDAVTRLQDALAKRRDVTLGGAAVANVQVGEQASADLAFAEMLAFPLLALLTLLIFRGVAALLPLAVGVATVLGAFAALRGINVVFPLSIFCLNLVIGAGLGLAIDYSLFLVSRFREELGRGAEVAAAVRTTMATAGRTVVFSSLTVASAMASLTVFPLRFLQSMGIGGAVVALVAGAVSLTVLPPLFVLLGRRLGKVTPAPEGEGRWYALAHGVMRRPGLVAAATAAALLLAALPALRAQWTGVDASILPTSRSARVVQDRLAAEFPRQDATTLVASVTAPRAAASDVAAYAERLRAVPGVTAVARPRPVAANRWLVAVQAAGSPLGDPAKRAVAGVRAVDGPFPVAVGGEAAQFRDRLAALGARLPLALGLLAGSTLVILWLMTGSVLLPVKALAMNLLTVGAATGLLVVVFQDGRLTGLLGYTSQGGLESADFLVLAAIAFALSTDYGVFLLTRIKEARDRGLGDREAVAVGLQHTGAIVTAAAVLLAVALGAFATSRVVFLKELGIGAAAAVLLDAFVVRTLLVPSLMALLGRWNWWAPAPLRRLHARIGISEGRPAPAPA